VVVVLVGFQQLAQYQQHWYSYRATAQALIREKYLYLAGAGVYAGADRTLRLAERVEGLIAQETTQWVESGTSASAQG
jgi:hypothetical protein